VVAVAGGSEANVFGVADGLRGDRSGDRQRGERVVTPYYQDDAVTLYLGNCCDLMPLLDLTVDHTITDPPYARDVYLRVRGDDSTGGKSPGNRGLTKPRALGAFGSAAVGNVPRLQRLAAGDIGYINEMLPFVAAVLPGITKRWAIVFSDAESTHMWRAELERFGMRYIRTGAWVKPDAMPQMTGDRPAVGFEPCTIAHGNARPMRWNGGGKQSLWIHNIAKGGARPDHPCPKPEPLMCELVIQFTDPGDMILDPFAGSGTTLVAAKRLGRKAIGIEINEQFAEATAKRLSQSALDLFQSGDAVARGGGDRQSLPARDKSPLFSESA
jgi:hypothetical protein